MTIAIKAELTTDLVTIRKFNEITKNGRKATLERHGKRTIPRHFRAGAESRYGYTPRSRAYVTRAKRQNPNWRPLVLTKHLMENMKTQQTVRGTRNRATLTLKNQGHPFMSKLPDRLRLEIEVILPEEQAEMAEFFEDYVTEQINDPKNRTKRRRKAKRVGG